MTLVSSDKREAQRQWNADPCGAETVRGFEAGTLEFYREARRKRYTEYAPWFDRVVRFDEWHDKDVLEVGVGLGSDHYRFARNANRMTALDLSVEHLRHTTRHLAMEGLRTHTILGDAENLPFCDCSFDLVYSFGVLHHTPDTERAIANIHRVLRPGGVAIVGLYHRESAFFWLQTIMVNGILKAGIVRKGLRGLLADIEYRSDPNSASPLVKVYSRSSMRGLFAGFRHIQLTTCHIEPAHFYRLAPVFRCVDRQSLERRLGRLGWYVVAEAVK